MVPRVPEIDTPKAQRHRETQARYDAKKRAERLAASPQQPDIKVFRRLLNDADMESELTAISLASLVRIRQVVEEGKLMEAAPYMKIILARVSRSLVEDQSEEKDAEMRALLGGLVREATGTEGMGTVTELREVLEVDRDED